MHCMYGDGVIGSQMRRRLLPEAGIPFTTAVLRDLYEADLSPFRMIVFLNAEYLGEDDLRMIRERACRDNRVVVWCNRPGIVGEDGVDVDRMEKVCGVPFASSGMGQRQFAQWKSVVFRDVASCTSEALRAAGKEAGLHFFSDDTGLRVWSSPEFLSVHARDGGPKTLRLKRRVRRVQELFSGRLMGEDCDSFTDEFASPDTKLYYLECQRGDSNA